MNNQNSTEPKLQPPGAGLPLFQKLFLKYWLGPVVSLKSTPAQDRKMYELITRKMIDSISKVPIEKRNIKVLVNPIPALEDSSRNWSLNGVMEHLLIVSKGIEAIILSLSEGKPVNYVVDIAKVKPTGVTQDLFKEFSEYAPGLFQSMDKKLSQPGFDIHSKTKHHHPWFGPIAPKQWYWLLSSHQGIHYKQVKGILKGLE